MWYNFLQMKQAIRNQIKAKLKGHIANDAPSQLLIQLRPLLDKSSSIAIYHANSYEISLDKVIHYCFKQHKELYQPVSYKNLRHMLLASLMMDQTDIFYPPEFVPEKTYEWYNLDLVLLPLIAADKLGYRLGKGGGYYDTTLSDVLAKPTRPVLCGIGFDFQLIDQVPHDQWDIRLDYFASDCQLIKF